MTGSQCDSIGNVRKLPEDESQGETHDGSTRDYSTPKNANATGHQASPPDIKTDNHDGHFAAQTESNIPVGLDSTARAIMYYDRLDRLLDRLESRIHKIDSKSRRYADSFSSDEESISDIMVNAVRRKVESDRQSYYDDDRARQPREQSELGSNMEDGKMNNVGSSDIVPKVRECDWEHFINRFSADEEICAIDVLLAGAELKKEVTDEEDKRSRHSRIPRFGRGRSQATQRVYKVKNNSQWIHRVRIQSTVLLEIFSRVTGYVWGPKLHTFIRPFQYLIYFHEKFKDELRRMEMESLASQDIVDQSQASNQEVNISVPKATETGESSSIEAAHPTSDPQSQSKKIGGSEALDYLRCYIDFAEEKLLPQYKRFQEGSSSTTLKIRFEDLWYLFRPGDLIYMPQKTLVKGINFLKPNPNVISTGDSSHESSMYQNIWRLHIGQAPPSQIDLLMEDSRRDEPFRVSCHYLDYDGTSYRAVPHNFWISSYKGEKDVTELDFYPLRFAQGGNQILCDYRQQGRMFTEAVSQWHLSYKGWTFVTDPVGVPIPDLDRSYAHSQTVQKRPEHIEGEVIVDFREAFNSFPAYKQSLNDAMPAMDSESTSDVTDSPHAIIVWSNSRRAWQVSTSEEAVIWNDDCDLQEYNAYFEKDPYLGKNVASNLVPDGDNLALLPPRLFVYSLQQQSFVPVNVRHLKPIPSQGSDAFSHLQLPDEHKRTIKAAVHSHLRRQRIERRIQSTNNGEVRTQDFILGKGRGLLIMLHGEPGVGKTATAEAVAQSTQRPLFSISCSDLQNYRFRPPEERLMEIFRLAHLWDCVLLMDEADVFLSSRSLAAGRDSMVSMFLRVLEYYNGILFLTTNRIGKLDPAISSRIHIIMHYKRLGPVEIENIFRLNIKRLQDTEQQQHESSGEPPLFVMEEDILRFAADHCKKNPKGKGAWNGRQIRNAFLTAASLARYEAEALAFRKSNFQPQLRYSHFQHIERLIMDYDRFRANVLGGDDSRRARLNEERDDDYDWDEEDRGTAPVGSQIDKAHQMYTVRRRQSGLSARAAEQSGGQQQTVHLGDSSYIHQPSLQSTGQWVNLSGTSNYSAEQPMVVGHGMNGVFVQSVQHPPQVRQVTMQDSRLSQAAAPTPEQQIYSTHEILAANQVPTYSVDHGSQAGSFQLSVNPRLAGVPTASYLGQLPLADNVENIGTT